MQFSSMPSLLQFQGAAAGTLYRVSIEKNFDLRIRENDGTDIAPLHDHVVFLADGALLLNQRPADGPKRSDA